MKTANLQESHGRDPSAFRTLVRDMEPRIRIWALGWVGGDADEADDVVQEVLVAVHLRLRTLRNPEALEQWLRVLTKNVFLQRRRRDRSRRRREQAAGVPFTSPHPTPLERVIARETGRRMERALKRLPAAQRRAVVLVALRGLSAAEAARTTGTSPVTVRSNLCRGRAALQRALSGPDDPVGDSAQNHSTREDLGWVKLPDEFGLLGSPGRTS